MTRPIGMEFRSVQMSRRLPAMDTATDDAELMLQYAAGNARAFDILYERHKGPLYRYLLRQCRNNTAADDLFQEVWGRVISHRKRYQARAKFATFLYRIAHNCAIDQFRLRARRREAFCERVEDSIDILVAPTAERPDRQLADAQFRAAFQRALDALPDDQRTVFLLYEESGLSLDEIGEIAGVGMETAKSRLRYAVGKLRKALGSAEEFSADDFLGSNSNHALPATRRTTTEEN
ncbi:MAG TPA: RNA polymerase sigma factor [Steroidobacteraceae bacterium]|nr:RNA polymerase sigma factor [Steroidobacteraceae bacterium]